MVEGNIQGKKNSQNIENRFEKERRHETSAAALGAWNFSPLVLHLS